jgi:hypothetical protein
MPVQLPVVGVHPGQEVVPQAAPHCEHREYVVNPEQEKVPVVCVHPAQAHP